MNRSKSIQVIFWKPLLLGTMLEVMVMDEQAMPLTRIWCIYEVLRTSVTLRKRTENSTALVVGMIGDKK